MTSYDFARVLTTGGSGMVGAYVDFGMRPDQSTLDIVDADAVTRYVEEHRPSAIIHLAGATDMERCEKDPGYAYELNVRGTYNVARAARRVGAVLVYASTSRVFKGDKHDSYAEDDIPEPDTEYGRTKHIGESITASMVPKHIIARTAWMFGGGRERDNKFFGKIIQQLSESSGEVLALRDVRGSPTYCKDYVAAIKDLLVEEHHGTFHVANIGDVTRYDIAVEIAARVGTATKVRPVDRSHFPSGAFLPANESIRSGHCHLRPWKEALAEYLTEEWGFAPTSATISA